MAGGFKFAIDFDTRNFKKGSDEAADSLEILGDELEKLEKADLGDVDKSFEDVADAAKDAGRDIDNKFTEKVDDAQDSARDLERKFKDAFDNVEKNADNAGDKIGKSAKDGFNRAKEGADEFKDSARQSAEEAASSFDGSLEGIADSAQEILSEAFAGFGPAGAAGGLIAAMGLGLAMTKLQEAADKINELKEETGDLALEFKEAGGRLAEMDLVAKFDEWLVAIEDTKQAWEFWQDDAITNLDNLNVALEGTGVSLGDLYNAFSEGDTSTLEEYVERLKEVNRELVPEGHQANTVAINDEYQARKNAISELEKEIEKRQEAEDVAYDMRAAEEGVTVEVIKQRDAMQERNAAMEEAAELNRGMIDSELDFLDTLDETTAKLQENAEAGWDKNTAAGRENLRALGDISEGALQYADSITEAGGSQEQANAVINQGRERLIAAAQQLGMTREQAESYATSLGLIPKEVDTTANAHTQTAEEQLNNVARRREAVIAAKAAVAGLQEAIDSAARRVRPPTIYYRSAVGAPRAV
ncbi:hypothetical protein FB00_11220 [Cellulosimicrobium funkei]|uniref:Uncharacterized protein n=1 Tax=Cellulosimicrobium funkei TaxID=264251 RepID=A0A0H2KM18_9MICO|nr:hypothetical protein [Cellulosimicrobium funkei]KLN34570.1 hypothetical protein FB00_11220 [Cellulosimicrobium funkei]